MQTGAVPYFSRYRGVRHRRRMLDQTLDAAQTFRQREDLRRRQQLHGILLRVILEREGHHASEILHLISGHGITGIRTKSGICTFATLGCSFRYSAIRRAFWQCRSIRRRSVFVPRSVRKQSNGPGAAPVDLIWNLSFSFHSSSFVQTTPPMTSEWPPRYCVVLCSTLAAPSASGCCRYGEANVLSTTTSMSRSAARSDTAAISIIRNNGLVGVSNQRTFVESRIAASVASISVMSTNENSMPNGS